MNEPCMVEWCDRPVGDGYVCQHCANRLERALGDVPALWDELDTVLTKQARYAAAEFRRGEMALPYNDAASELGWVLRNTLVTWVNVILDERGCAAPKAPEFRRVNAPRPVVADKISRRCENTLLPIAQCEHCRKAA